MRQLITLPFLILLSLLLAQPNIKSQPMVLAITHVTVVDATGSPASPNMTVVITGARITEIGKTEKIRLPKDARVVNGTGKFLIPGLWDMHAHPFLITQALPPQLLFNLYIANGVTGLRDPSGPLEVQLQWRKAVAAGEVLGPQMIVSGPILDGPSPMWPSVAIAIGAEKEARSAVAALKQRGADFIKVYDFLPRDAYFAIVDEAKKQRIPLAGHIPISVTAAEAIDAGQRSVEHVIHLFESCSTIEAELQQDALRIVREATAAGREPNLPALFLELLQIEVKALKTYDEAKAQALFARFVKNGAYEDPTLIAHGYEQGADHSSDARLKYAPAFLKESWKPENYILSKAFMREDLANAKILFQKRVELNPARFFDLQDSLGTVERGKIADLVLLDANPLQDIRHTQKIHAVVVNGRLLDRTTLDDLLAKAATAGQNK